MTLFSKIMKYVRKPWVLVLGGIFILTLIIIVSRGGNESDVLDMEVKRVTVKEEVSVTGKVIPIQKSDLGFEKGGTVAAVNVKVGDRVTRGQTIATLSDRQTYASLLGAQANLKAAEANLADTQANTAIDYTSARRNVLNALRDAYAKIDSLMVTQVDTFFTNGTSINPTLTIAAETYNQQRDLENKRYAVTQALALWKSKVDAGTPENAEQVLSAIQGYISTINSLMGNLTTTVQTYVRNNSAAVSKTTLDSYLAAMNTANANLATAISGATTAENALSSAAPKSIKALQARIDQARAEVTNYQAQYAKSIIVAPYNGTVTKAEPQPGDTAAAGQPDFSIISSQAFKVEANIAEADIAKVKVGQKAKITLDAYGQEAVFFASVQSINPAETVIDGVPTYTTTFVFDADDPRIKSGMTANIDIEGEARVDVLAVPQRAIVEKEGKKFVTVREGETTREVEITAGLRGFDGLVEITSGLNAGDQVVLDPEA